ncbi:hypothetical protein [Emticicia sp.]|uniref:hypothetical protein n=1 Tax=Emticicia sp. TaxID=1930953 RepID=UPI003751FBE6
MSIEEQHLLLEIKIQLQKGNIFVARRELQKLLEKAEKLKTDGFKLFYVALKPIYDEQVHLNSSPAFVEKASLECKICQKIFQKGVSSWKGAKRVCKKPCTQNDLIPCQISSK